MWIFLTEYKLRTKQNIVAKLSDIRWWDGKFIGNLNTLTRLSGYQQPNRTNYMKLTYNVTVHIQAFMKYKPDN